jgi:hypothetical protein
MKATHYDHQSHWWEDCECQDCQLTKDEFVDSAGRYSCVPTRTRGGLIWDGLVSRIAWEPSVIFLRCAVCDKLYAAVESFGEVPMLYPVHADEEDGLMGTFYREMWRPV